MLLRNFSKNKPLIIISQTGNIGTGKSTFSNTLIYHLLKINNIKISPTQIFFKPGKSNITVTRGIYAFPYPLFINP
jgi:hypothetical protein